MNINAVSAGYKSTNVYNTVNFKGVQKAATRLANTGAAKKASNKTGRAGQFFSKVSHTIGNACSKVFSGVKKAAVTAYNFTAKGIHTAFNAVKTAGKKVSDTISNFFKGFKNKKCINISTNNSTIIQIGKGKTAGDSLVVSIKDKNVIINGKIYQYDGKLPEGMEISSGGFSLKGKESIKSLTGKIKEFAQNVEKNGKLIGTAE